MAFTYQSREYQSRLVEATVKAFIEDDPFANRPSHSAIILSPCGSGKTVTAMRIVEEMYGHGYKKIVFIAHRHKLLNQALEYVELMELKKKLPELEFHAVSIYDRNYKELANPDLVIFDEAHHSACDSGIRLVDKISPKRILGLTATNWRSDRIKLVFEKVIQDYGINALIEMGYLSQYDHYIIDDWTPDTVTSTYINDIPRFGKSIMYFHTTEESEEAVRLLKLAGVNAESLYGTHSESQREAAYERFENGETTVLCNLLLLTEGADFPDLKTVFAKPSIKGLTIQMAGRGLRTAEGKTHANIVQMKGGLYGFTRVAACRNAYCAKDGKWIQTKFSKQFLDSLGRSTMEYKITMSRDSASYARMEIVGLAGRNKMDMNFLGDRRELRKITELEDLAKISEGD